MANLFVCLAVIAAMVAGSHALTCFSCEGNTLTCEKSYTTVVCSASQIYCRLDVNSANYPFVQQTCADSCVDSVGNVKSTYCTRSSYGNCYQTQCNAVNGAASVIAATSMLAVVALPLAF